MGLPDQQKLWPVPLTKRILDFTHPGSIHTHSSFSHMHTYTGVNASSHKINSFDRK